MEPSQNVQFENAATFGISRHQERRDAPIKVNFGIEEHTIGSLLYAKFLLDR